jgi:hypothetical protein
MQTIRCKYGLAAGLCLFLACFPLLAQEEWEGRVSSAEGGGFVLAAGGQRAVFQAEGLDAEGLGLQDGDTLRTDPGAFVEIQLIPRGTLVKVAGNTSLVFKTGENGVALELAYGRILILGGPGEDPAEFLSVRPGTSELVFRGGDIGVDYIIRTAGEASRQEPQIRVYAFSGSAELRPREEIPAGGAGRTAFPVHEGEMVSLETANAFSYVAREPLDPEILNYWSRHLPPGRLSPPAEAAEAPVSVPEGNTAARGGRVLFIPPDYKPFFRTNTIKNGFIAAGITFSLIGAGMQGFSWYMPTDNSVTNDILRDTGYGFIGLGILSLGAALFINPKAPESDGAK